MMRLSSVAILVAVVMFAPFIPGEVVAAVAGEKITVSVKEPVDVNAECLNDIGGVATEFFQKNSSLLKVDGKKIKLDDKKVNHLELYNEIYSKMSPFETCIFLNFYDIYLALLKDTGSTDKRLDAPTRIEAFLNTIVVISDTKKGLKLGVIRKYAPVKEIKGMLYTDLERTLDGLATKKDNDTLKSLFIEPASGGKEGEYISVIDRNHQDMTESIKELWVYFMTSITVGALLIVVSVLIVGVFVLREISKISYQLDDLTPLNIAMKSLEGRLTSGLAQSEDIARNIEALKDSLSGGFREFSKASSAIVDIAEKLASIADNSRPAKVQDDVGKSRSEAPPFIDEEEFVRNYNRSFNGPWNLSELEKKFELKKIPYELPYEKTSTRKRLALYGANKSGREFYIVPSPEMWKKYISYVNDLDKGETEMFFEKYFSITWQSAGDPRLAKPCIMEETEDGWVIKSPGELHLT